MAKRKEMIVSVIKKADFWLEIDQANINCNYEFMILLKIDMISVLNNLNIPK